MKIADMAEMIIEKFKPTHGACLYMSALLVAMINDHLTTKAKFVTGTLNVGGITIFSHSPLKEILSSNENYISDWDGHAWVSVPGFIIDLSIFQTIYSEKTPNRIQNAFSSRLDRHPKYLIGQESKLVKTGIIYKELEVLNDDHATLFIENADRLGLLGS